MLFREGRTLTKAGKPADACPKFEESHRLDPQIGTLLNLALCHEEIGKTASAWAEFNEVAERSAGLGQRVLFAHEHAKAVEAKLSQLRVRVEPAVTDIQLKLDGRPLGAGVFDSPIPLDPGAHALEAAAPGKARWADRVTLPPGPTTLEIVVTLVNEP